MLWNKPSRRNFLTRLGSTSLLGGLLPSVGAAHGGTAKDRDVIAQLGVPPIINAAGTYTSLTASLMPPEVMAAIHEASTKYVRLDELHDAVGKRAAELLECEAAMISAGCASALSLATATCVAGNDPEKIRKIPDTHGMKDEVICQKTHRVGYDHAIRNAGVKIIEVETRQDVELAVNHKTAMMFFLNKAANDGEIGYEEFIELGKKYDIPTLNDAAADVPPVDNLFRYTKMGFDLVAFSGGKGLKGPQSAGLLLGRKDLIDAARLSFVPYADTLCRTNKVNKEEMVGMLVALELYLEKDHEAEWKLWEDRCATVAQAVETVPTVETEVFVPEIANAVPHLRITWDHDKIGRTYQEVHDAMANGDPQIELRPGARDDITVGVWMMQEGDAEIVAKRLAQELKA